MYPKKKITTRSLTSDKTNQNFIGLKFDTIHGTVFDLLFLTKVSQSGHKFV